MKHAAGPPTPRRATPGVMRGCLLVAGILLAALSVAFPHGASAQGGASLETERRYDPPVRTDSPRETLATFLWLSDEMEAVLLRYTVENTSTGAARLALLSDQMVSLIDLEPIARSSRREVGIRTTTYMMDIFGRIGSPDLAAVPDSEDVEDVDEPSFRIPGTPLRIVRITEGERVGEYLFSSSSVDIAPRFFRAVGHLPLESPLEIESFSEFGPQLTGPLFPAGVVDAIPATLKRLWLDTPIWKVVTLAAVVAAILVALLALQRLLAVRTPGTRLLSVLKGGVLPLAILFAASVVTPYLSHQLNISGRFAAIVQTSETVIVHAAYAWVFWLAVRLLFEAIIRSPGIPDESLDANLLRLISGVAGILGGAIILAFGGQAIGLPILSVLAGLGIGGLAIALALRPTLENLVGGVILYMDRPVRVGDFCSFNDRMGTIEGIGIRSTTLRALDRTIISVPNAQFADMEIVNWAQCDQMLIHETIGVRYETTPDQLRYLLAELRRMFHAHPRIDSNTVRVRFAGYGASALNIDVRVYAATREWNDFFAIREDVFLRVYDIVKEAGTGFAFPSQTVYMARDDGLDEERGGTAEEAVARWRRSGRLPFPRLPRDEIDRLESTLDYPPCGSPEAAADTQEIVDEPLSVPERLSDTASPEAEGAGERHR